MKYALVNGQRQEAQRGCSGVCPVCGSPMVPRCGNVRVHHWGHRGRRDCDAWWENETEWHRGWKNLFPVNWQEVVQQAENGERHIADVKTDQGWVLEFQHSKIHPDERKAREVFYRQLVWIVDGARRKRDKLQFFKALEVGRVVVKKINLIKMPFAGECALLRDWGASPAPVFFDFSGGDKPEGTQLWCLIRVINGMAYVGPFSRESFIKYHDPEAKGKGQDFSELWRHINAITEEINRLEKINQSHQAVVFLDPLTAKLRRRERSRRMRRFRNERRK